MRRNRFIHGARTDKSILAFEAFATGNHYGPDLALWEALLEACLESSQCQHTFPDNIEGAMNRGAIDLYYNTSLAWFCMQSAGHTPTRRSTFDCLLARSIPVLFSDESVAHFPFADAVDPSEFSLLVSQDDVAKLFSSILPNILQGGTSLSPLLSMHICFNTPWHLTQGSLSGIMSTKLMFGMMPSRVLWRP